MRKKKFGADGVALLCAPVKWEIVGKPLENRRKSLENCGSRRRRRPSVGNFSILCALMLEIYETDLPEICVGVVPHALVCAKKNLVRMGLLCFARP